MLAWAPRHLGLTPGGELGYVANSAWALGHGTPRSAKGVALGAQKETIIGLFSPQFQLCHFKKSIFQKYLQMSAAT